MGLQRKQRVCSKKFIRCFQRQEVTRQCGNIFGTLAQWRNAQLELAQAVEKILAETPFFHRQLKILIGSRDHAHVNGNFSMPTQTEIWSAVQNAQQFHLDLRLQLANLIEKNRALVSQFK